MELKGVLQKSSDIIKKYRYVILILAIGIILMMIPGNGATASKTSKSQHVSKTTLPSLEEMLPRALEKIRGAGKVDVLLTRATGEETIYQTDDNQSETTSNYTTVTITDSGRNESGLVRQINPPQYLGALVICQGADDPEVRLAIVSAVSKLTGLGANQISVLKMK